MVLKIKNEIEILLVDSYLFYEYYFTKVFCFYANCLKLNKKNKLQK